MEDREHCPRDWVSYWHELKDGQLLFREEAEEYVRNLASAERIDRGMRVLDFGCGYGFVAEGLAPLVGQIYLWDAAESMLVRARSRLAGHPNVHVLDLSGPSDPPGELRFNLILVNSVVQYLSEDEFLAWLARWRVQLAPSGKIVISDIIPPDHPPAEDILSLLTFSTRRGYLFRALRNVLGEHKRYQKMRQLSQLHEISPGQLRRHATLTGLNVRILPRNLTHFSGRFTAVCSIDSDDRRLPAADSHTAATPA
jgi:SAM-dependent methyltransferase